MASFTAINHLFDVIEHAWPIIERASQVICLVNPNVRHM